jgi:DNA repair protein RecN (Recombination protein N)
VDFNPASLQKINDRLDLIYKLQHKHSAADIKELLRLKDEYDHKLQNISSLSEEIDKKKEELERIRVMLNTEADTLSEKRKSIFSDLEKRTGELLTRMGMPDGKVVIEHHILEQPARDGKDEIRFLFTANKGVAPGDLSKIASGGELSRLMLSIKSLISERRLLPTIIFDEIDNGISGDIAGKVGDVMLDASENMQVVAITHLPQIAGRGQHHYIVFKETDGEITVSKMKKIEEEERIVEIAKMLSGDNQTTSTRETAREFLKKTGSRN